MAVIESIAAATRRLITRKGNKQEVSTNSGTSTIAWDLWETVPEVGAYADWIANAMSGATLFAGRRNPDGTVDKAPDESRAAQLVSAMAGGADGQSVMLSDVGVQLAVAGEFWTVIVPDVDDTVTSDQDMADDRWLILSTQEVTQQRGKIAVLVDGQDLDVPEYDPENPDESAPAAFRTWKPSPRKHHLATSPVIRAITVLEELRLLNAAVAAIARSRITGRGVLLVPAGSRFPTTPGQDQAEDSLLDTFIEVASTAIQQPESAAATVPIILEVPGDLISGVKWLQFDSEFDALAIQLREEAIRRFAVGADIPAEVLLGLGDTNHWGAWALTAEALRLGVEPKLALFCQSLTESWLRPLLESEDDPEAGEWLVWYDTAGLRSSSNKGANALEAHRQGLISDAAARRELGFTEDDKPTGSTTTTRDTERGDLPVDSTQTAPALSAADSGMVLDSFTAGTTAAVAAAVDGLVFAALAVAGRKLINTPVVPRPHRLAARDLAVQAAVHVHHKVEQSDVVGYRLLDGVWDRVPQVAGRYGLDAFYLTAALQEYTTALLVSGQPHEFDNVPRLLAQMKVCHAEGAAA